MAAVLIGGIGIGLLWLAAGFWGVARLGRRAEVVRDPEWLRAAHEAAERLGLRRPVLLVRTPGGLMPATWGLLWPTVALPAAAEQWSEDRRRAALAHERAGNRLFGDFDFGRDARAIFEERPDNIFVLKASYWIGR